MQKFDYAYCMKRSTCRFCKYEMNCEQFLKNNTENKTKHKKKKKKKNKSSVRITKKK